MKTLLLVTAAAILGASLVAALLREHESSLASPLSADPHWSNAVRLTGPDSAADDVFGFSVAIDGDVALVGAPECDRSGANSGAVYAFEKGQGAIDLGRDDTSAFGEFGHAVALNGNLALIGKPGDSEFGKDAGAAYLYRRDDRKHWNRVGRLVAADAAAGERFGESVAIEENTVLAGSYGYGIRGTGSVYVFQEDERGVWRQQAKLDSGINTPDDRFGCQIAIDGNLVVVGASGSNTNSGVVYLFERDGSGNWSKLIGLTPPGGRANSFFGDAVALWDRTVVVGAPGIGSVFLFREDDSGKWQQVAKLYGDDATLPAGFGRSVAISAKGLIVGAPQMLDPAGAAYLFKSNSDGVWQRTSKIALPAPPSRRWFGNAMAVSGEALLVGARYADGNAPTSGAAYLLDLSWSNNTEHPE
jgi:hypothetical protein